MHYFAILLQEKRKSFLRKKMVGPWYGWFIDYWKTFHAYSWGKQVKQYNNNYIGVKEEWESQSNAFWLPLEMYRELYRSEQMLPSIAATMRILFFVVYYRGLLIRANTLLAMIYGQISRIITW
jgi:hypothetical protein